MNFAGYRTNRDLGIDFRGKGRTAHFFVESMTLPFSFPVCPPGQCCDVTSTRIFHVSLPIKFLRPHLPPP